MTMQDDIPDLNASTNELARYAPSGLVDCMDAEQLGAFTRLLQHSWRETPPCSLPCDEGELALVARTDRWERVRPVILRAFKPDQLPGSTRLVNAVALEIFNALCLKKANASQSGQAAARARWSAKPAQPMRSASDSHATRMRSASDPHPVRIAAPSLRSESSPEAPAPLRSSSPDESKRSAERTESADSVIANLGAGARAQELLTEKHFANWCIERSTFLLEQALADWNRKGLCEVPLTKAREMARHQGATPPVVETAISIANGEIERRERTCGGKAIDFKPFGKLVVLLGQRRSGENLPPIEPTLWIRKKWEQQFIEARATCRAQSAIDLRRMTTNVSNAARAGGA